MCRFITPTSVIHREVKPLIKILMPLHYKNVHIPADSLDGVLRAKNTKQITISWRVEKNVDICICAGTESIPTHHVVVGGMP